MAGKVHLIRHAHGQHNVEPPEGGNPDIPDPDITEHGEEQADALRTDFPHSSKVGLIITSPLTRAIQTSLRAFSNIIDERFYAPGEGGTTNGISIIVDPYFEEEGDQPANTGSSLETLKAKFPHLDLSTLQEGWEVKDGEFGIEEQVVQARMKKVKKIIAAKIDELKTGTKKDLVVMTHGGVIYRLCREIPNPTEYRSFSVQRTNGGIRLNPAWVTPTHLDAGDQDISGSS